MNSRRARPTMGTLALLCAALAAVSWACGIGNRGGRTFAAPDEAVRELIAAAKAAKLDDVAAIFGSEGRELIDSADPATTRRNLRVFTVAVAERWQLVGEENDRKMLVIGNEQWPFPVPLSRDGARWRFDTAAGKEEVLARRIGRNELAAIRICRTYVAAQRLYAGTGHDGRRAGLYAQTFRSDPNRQNGLYWPASPHHKRSPLGDLVARAAEEGRPIGQDTQAPAPFHGYYVRILTSQGTAAPGGPKDYVSNGEMSEGFGLVAWPAQYDVTGVMTFVVNHYGVVHEKDLGPETGAAALARSRYNPDASWRRVQ